VPINEKSYASSSETVVNTGDDSSGCTIHLRVITSKSVHVAQEPHPATVIDSNASVSDFIHRLTDISC